MYAFLFIFRYKHPFLRVFPSHTPWRPFSGCPYGPPCSSELRCHPVSFIPGLWLSAASEVGRQSCSDCVGGTSFSLSASCLSGRSPEVGRPRGRLSLHVAHELSPSQLLLQLLPPCSMRPGHSSGAGWDSLGEQAALSRPWPV